VSHDGRTPPDEVIGGEVLAMPFQSVASYSFSFSSPDITNVTIKVLDTMSADLASRTAGFDFTRLPRPVNLSISAPEGSHIPHVKGSFAGKVDHLSLKFDYLVPGYSSPTDLKINRIELEEPFAMTRETLNFKTAGLIRGIRYGSLRIFENFDRENPNESVPVKEVVIPDVDSVIAGDGQLSVHTQAGITNISATQQIAIETKGRIMLDVASTGAQVGVKIIHAGDGGIIDMGASISSTANVAVTLLGGTTTVKVPGTDLPVALGGCGKIQIAMVPSNAISGLTVSKAMNVNGDLDLEMARSIARISVPKISLSGQEASFRVLKASTGSSRPLAEEFTATEVRNLEVSAGTIGTVTAVTVVNTVINEFATLNIRGNSTGSFPSSRVEIKYVHGDFVPAPVLTFSDGATADGFGSPNLWYTKVRDGLYIQEAREQVIARSEVGGFDKIGDWLAAARVDSRDYQFQAVNGMGTVDLVVGPRKGGNGSAKKESIWTAGAIAGVVIAVIVVIVILIVLLVLFLSYRRRNNLSSSSLSSSSDIERVRDDEASI
jgi:hypothetical protein